MPRLSSRLAIIGLALGIIAVSPWVVVVRTQDRQPTRAFVTVLDQNEAPVTNLQPSQVSMVIDGVTCPTVKLEPINWPMRVTLLVDSGGVWQDALSNLREGLRRLVAEVPEGVEISLMTLAPQPRWIVQPTMDRQALLAGIDLITSVGAAKLIDGLGQIASQIDRQKGDVLSTIMIVGTNGPEDSGGDRQRAFDQLRSKLARHPVTVHVVLAAIAPQQRGTGPGNATAPGNAPGNGARPGSAAPRGGAGAGAGGGSAGGRVGAATRGTPPGGLVYRVPGALETQIGLGLTMDTGGRFENIALASGLLTLLPEYGRQIARSQLIQSHEYRVSCGSISTAAQMSVFTSYPGSRGVVLSRDGHVP